MHGLECAHESELGQDAARRKRKPKCSFTGSNGGEFEDISSIEIYSEEDNDVAKTATLKKGQMAMTKKPKKPKRNSKFNRIFRHVDIA